MESITAAANTEVPAFLALKQIGLLVSRQILSIGSEVWVAEDETTRYSAPSPLELLGIYLLRQERGEQWKASDLEIQDFLASYYPDALS